MSITPEQWMRAKELFHEVKDLSPAERSAFLAKHCPDDAQVCATVEHMAASHGNMDPDFLEPPVVAGVEVDVHLGDVVVVGVAR